MTSTPSRVHWAEPEDPADSSQSQSQLQRKMTRGEIRELARKEREKKCGRGMAAFTPSPKSDASSRNDNDNVPAPFRSLAENCGFKVIHEDEDGDRNNTSRYPQDSGEDAGSSRTTTTCTSKWSSEQSPSRRCPDTRLYRSPEAHVPICLSPKRTAVFNTGRNMPQRKVFQEFHLPSSRNQNTGQADKRTSSTVQSPRVVNNEDIERPKSHRGKRVLKVSNKQNDTSHSPVAGFTPKMALPSSECRILKQYLWDPESGDGDEKVMVGQSCANGNKATELPFVKKNDTEIRLTTQPQPSRTARSKVFSYERVNSPKRIRAKYEDKQATGAISKSDDHQNYSRVQAHNLIEVRKSGETSRAVEMEGTPRTSRGSIPRTTLMSTPRVSLRGTQRTITPSKSHSDTDLSVQQENNSKLQFSSSASRGPRGGMLGLLKDLSLKSVWRADEGMRNQESENNPRDKLHPANKRRIPRKPPDAITGDRLKEMSPTTVNPFNRDNRTLLNSVSTTPETTKPPRSRRLHLERYASRDVAEKLWNICPQDEVFMVKSPSSEPQRRTLSQMMGRMQEASVSGGLDVNNSLSDKRHQDIECNINSNYEDSCENELSASAFIGQYLFELWKNQCLCDVKLKVGNTCFLAHKIVLAAFSDVFCPREPQNLPTVTFCIPNTTPEAVCQILQYLYTSEMELTDNTLEEVYAAATFMGIDEIVKLVDQILSQPTLENFDVYAMNSLDTGDPRLQKYFEKRKTLGLPTNLLDFPDLLRDNFVELSSTAEFGKLNLCDLQAILEDPEVKVDSELDVVHAIIQWMQFNPMSRMRFAAGLLGLVNFDLIEPEELSCIVEQNKHLFDLKAMAVLMDAFKELAVKCRPNTDVPTAIGYVNNANIQGGFNYGGNSSSGCKDGIYNRAPSYDNDGNEDYEYDELGLNQSHILPAERRKSFREIRDAFSQRRREKEVNRPDIWSGNGSGTSPHGRPASRNSPMKSSPGLSYRVVRNKPVRTVNSETSSVTSGYDKNLMSPSSAGDSGSETDRSRALPLIYQHLANRPRTRRKRELPAGARVRRGSSMARRSRMRVGSKDYCSLSGSGSSQDSFFERRSGSSESKSNGKRVTFR